MAVRGVFGKAAAYLFKFSPFGGCADPAPVVSAETRKKAIAILVFIGISVRSKAILRRMSEQFSDASSSSEVRFRGRGYGFHIIAEPRRVVLGARGLHLRAVSRPLVMLAR